MSFEAKYPGRCGICDNRIDVGDQCTYSEDEVVHTKCDGPPKNPRDGMCTQCFLVHAGECA